MEKVGRTLETSRIDSELEDALYLNKINEHLPRVSKLPAEVAKRRGRVLVLVDAEAAVTQAYAENKIKAVASS